jgi:hypothetical protein
MAELRLGDVIDDWCIKCRRLTNHSIVSIVDGTVAKVRCRTCYHDHDYRHEEPPPSKKDLKKQALFDEVLSSIHPGSGTEADETTGPAAEASVEVVQDAGSPAKEEAETAQAAAAAPSKKKTSRKGRNG